MNVVVIRAWDDSGVQHLLDVKENQSFPTSFNLADVTELKNSKGSFNKSIDLPATEANVAYFGQYWNVNEVDTFDTKTKKRAILEYDTVKVLDGFIQLVEVKVENGSWAEFNVRIFSDEAGLFKSTENKLLKDLDLSDFDHEVTLANVVDGFTGHTTAGGETIYYGLQDYGSQITTSIWGGGTNRLYHFRVKPYLKLKSLFDAVMSAAGYTYESNFLDGAYFNSLYLLAHSGDNELSIDSAGYHQFKAGIISDISLPSTASTTIEIPFEDESSFDFEDPNSVHDFDVGPTSVASGFRPDVDTNGLGLSGIKLRVSFEIENTGGIVCNYNYQLRRIDANTSVDNPLSAVLATGDILPAETVIVTHDFETEISTLFNIDDFYFYIAVSSGTGSFSSSCNILSGADTFFECYEDPQIPTVNLPTSFALDFEAERNVPQEMQQVDILRFLDNRFNCLFVRDKIKQNHFIIEPYTDYISGGAEKDWSQKIDLSKTYTVKPLSNEEKKEVEFTTKEGDDLLNKLVKDNAGRIYGRQKFINDVNEYATGTKKIESPDTVSPLNAISGTQIMIPRLYTDDLNPVDGSFRVFVKGDEYSSEYDGSGFFLRDQDDTASAEISTYTHFGHYSSPIPDGTDTDLNYGQEVPFHSYVEQPSDTAYERYWRAYLDQLYGDEARVLTAYFNLTLFDIETFEWSDKIYVLNAWWTVNKIEGFDPIDDKPTKVELIRFSAALSGMKSLSASDKPRANTSAALDTIK